MNDNEGWEQRMAARAKARADAEDAARGYADTGWEHDGHHQHNRGNGTYCSCGAWLGIFSIALPARWGLPVIGRLLARWDGWRMSRRRCEGCGERGFWIMKGAPPVNDNERTDQAIWCYCYGTPEPDRPWIYPDDGHADTCGVGPVCVSPLGKVIEITQRISMGEPASLWTDWLKSHDVGVAAAATRKAREQAFYEAASDTGLPQWVRDRLFDAALGARGVSADPTPDVNPTGGNATQPDQDVNSGEGLMDTSGHGDGKP